MPTYQVTLQAEGIMSIRNYFAPTVWETIDKIIEAECDAEWVGEIEYIELHHIGLYDSK